MATKNQPENKPGMLDPVNLSAGSSAPAPTVAPSVKVPMPDVVPFVPVTQTELNIWYELTKKLEEVKNQELALRVRVFKTYFKDPVEGTNTVPLSAGWVLKGTHKLTRKVDEAMLATRLPELRAAGLRMDDLVRYKAELGTAEFRKLTEEQHKLFDTVLEIKVGTPSVEIVLPKRATSATAAPDPLA